MLNSAATNEPRLLRLIGISIVICFYTTNLTAQVSRRVLFLGNSYTGVNNLPQMVHDVALSAGDTLIFDNHNPGGYRLVDHYGDIITQSKIMAGGWNYIVLQGQSQEPVVASSNFFNGALALYGLAKQYSPCVIPMPYMTWGRKNGDASTCAQFSAMCTYESMDSALKKNYIDLTTSINGELSPVSVVWRKLRQDFPSLELYQPDESHPSVAGTYAAACCFYASIFKKDPTLISFSAGLDATDAQRIREVVKATVFQSLQSWDFKKLPVSNITFQVTGANNEVQFNALAGGVRQKYYWDFGDGNTSTDQSPAHTYATNGTFNISLTTKTCDLQGWHISSADTVIQFCSHTPSIYVSHPWLCKSDTLWTQAANDYRWFGDGQLLPENTRYLLNGSHPNISSYSVIATANGCSELSRSFSNTREWSGYYFDVIGDPCTGDTVDFAVLHIDGSLSGAETILWYKNDWFLPSMINHDTMLITGSGKYECKVINPNSICPVDTTSYSITYDCGDEEAVEPAQQSWMLFPNPATQSVTIRFSQTLSQDQLGLHNAMGALMKLFPVNGSPSININIADLPRGIYFLQSRKNKLRPLKLIKL